MRISTLYNVCPVTLGGYHEYIWGCSVHQGDSMSTSEDTTSTLGDIISTSGVYHEYIGDVQYIRGI